MKQRGAFRNASYKPLTVFAKSSIADIRLGSKYASEIE